MKRKLEWSKIVTVLVILLGFAVSQECVVLMYLCIRDGYASAAAWLTAAVGLAEAVMGAGLTGYLSLAKSDHRQGGITYDSDQAKQFKQEDESQESPGI